ncbi:hypothetical protein [Dyadobacter luticola]|uniref:Uncharacterized protein n=1 Tax=Dyadobacter luticola TaxID=1979387 RepID=A0A5R9KYU7_9BACT|nr:hypothetical protein [Dyadobacter luticola]TLV01328.1 hypothetical protein FEN17_17995 [Dyadobacter luticola]
MDNAHYQMPHNLDSFNESDWYYLLIDILDGEYGLDVRKLGSSGKFIKNQLGLCKRYNLHEQYVANGIEKLWVDCDFENQSPQNYSKLSHLIKWVDDFLPKSAKVAKRLLYLFIHLNEVKLEQVDSSSKISLAELTISTAFVILNVAKSNRRRNGLVHSEAMTILEHEKIWNIVQKWINSPAMHGEYLAPGILLMIYFQKWSSHPSDKREQALIFVQETSERIRNIFMAILADLQNTTVNLDTDYIYFVDDIKAYAPDLYYYIEKYANNWTQSTAETETKESIRDMIKKEKDSLNKKPIEARIIDLRSKIEKPIDNIRTKGF